METSEQIQDFCRRYFQAVDAPILIDQPDFMQVELPREIDKELIYRPYFWMFREMAGEEIPNTILSMKFQKDIQIEGINKIDHVALGKPLLNNIIDSTKKRGRFTRAYQSLKPFTAATLTPVLLTTFKRSFVADRRLDEMISYAVNLRTEQVMRDVYEKVASLPFSAQPNNMVHLHQPTLSIEQGYQAIRQQCTAEISALDHTWAADADAHLERELEQLETYYESLGLVNSDELKTDEEKAKKAAMYAAERELRISELKWRCAPRIHIEPFHFGLLYVADGVLDAPFTGTTKTGNRLSM
ncbi:MAG: YqhG family protein [Tumebacillaceae bacterium]